jgi:tryptophan halogenase
MNQRSVADISIIGGGTAGWLTALYAKTVMPTKAITVIESDEIGILGAGEGSTVQFVELLDMIDIPVSLLVKETGATIKNGIKFTNWNNEGNRDFFYHGFSSYGNTSASFYNQKNIIASSPTTYVIGSLLGDHINNYSFSTKLSENSKVGFLYDENRADPNVNPILHYEQSAAFSLHFDAVKLAEFLKKTALERGIRHVEGVVKDFKQKEDGDVNFLILKSGKEIKCDFVFDCSGFQRFFAKKFKSKWISYKSFLPVDTAVSFFLPMEEDSIPPYTEAIAMKYGWIWKIPLQDRYGCGYVFDSSLITEEEAKQEVKEFLKDSVEFRNTFSFEAGYYKTPWQNNVISIGLSAGFVEPLEATSIWTSIASLSKILGSTELLYKIDQRIVDDFNESFEDINEQVLSFIYFHYMSGREDTDFWKKFSKEKAPKYLKNIYDKSDFRLLQYSDFLTSIWPIESWYQVGIGTDQLNIFKFSKASGFYNYTSTYSKANHVFLKKTQDELVEKYCPTHKKFLDLLKGK